MNIQVVQDIWLQFSSYGQLIIKGLLIGIIASAPMGPVGVLCVRRTMQKGRIYGLVTGAGAALSDFIYALIVGAGMAFASTLIENEQNIFWMKLGGSILLFVFGVIMLRTKPKNAPQPSQSNKGKGSLFQNFLTAFLLTFSNPLIIFLFLAVFSALTFVIPGHWFGQAVGYASIIGGAMLWWFGLTYVLKRLKNSTGENFAVKLNKTIGVIVLVASLIYAANTVFHLNLPFFH